MRSKAQIVTGALTLATAGALVVGLDTAATAATVPAKAPAACKADQVTVTIGQIDAGAGQRYAPLTFSVHGTTTCTLTGFISKAEFIARDGSALPTNASHWNDHVAPTTLSTGHDASVVLHWEGIPADDENIDQAPPAYLKFRIPGDSHDLTVRWPDDPTFQHGQLQTGAIHAV
ncbi:hypothetical protein GCM10009765_28020 [Fodinicola feengrottensis]|uniref:DUF4232 domain-containing protein n=1 Tax=Fodinicola feengrottensis TaxID=435914 RepID=A0ABN2GUL1_9ACTN